MILTVELAIAAVLLVELLQSRLFLFPALFYPLTKSLVIFRKLFVAGLIGVKRGKVALKSD